MIVISARPFPRRSGSQVTCLRMPAFRLLLLNMTILQYLGNNFLCVHSSRSSPTPSRNITGIFVQPKMGTIFRKVLKLLFSILAAQKGPIIDTDRRRIQHLQTMQFFLLHALKATSDKYDRLRLGQKVDTFHDITDRRRRTDDPCSVYRLHGTLIGPAPGAARSEMSSSQSAFSSSSRRGSSVEIIPF